MVKARWLAVRVGFLVILLVACRSEARVQPTPVLREIPRISTNTPLPTVTPDPKQVDYNQTVRGSINGMTREEVWYFRGNANEMVSISAITVIGTLEPMLSLYSSDNELLLVGTSAFPFFAQLTATLPTDGIYRVVVASEDTSTGQYELVVSTALSEGRLVYGNRVTGVLNAEQPVGNWTFDAVAGDFIDITVRANDELDTRLDLYDADGNTVVSNDDTDELNPALKGYPILQSGAYTIAISPVGQIREGTYELELREVEGEGGVLGLDSTAEGEYDDSFHVWRFEGEAGREISVQVEATGDSIFDPYVELYSPNGILLASDDDSGEGTDAFIRQVTLPETGTYYILISALSGSGDFTLTLAPAKPPISMGTVRYDQTVTGTLTDNDEHAWTLAMQSGDVLNIAVNRATNAPNLDVKVALTDDEGTILASDDDGGGDTNALIREYPLLVSGTYTIVVSAFSGEGAYTLSVSRVAATPIAIGETVRGEVSRNGAVLWWFDGVAGAHIDMNAISTVPDTSLDLTLSLYNAEGQLLVYDDDSGEGLNALIEDWIVPRTQRYMVVVRALSGEGAFTLSLRPAP
jgi:hypothetical protein